MWLYLLVLIGTVVVIVVPAQTIDGVFLALIAAIFVTAGFTIIMMFVTHVRLMAILGEPPKIIQLVISLLIGIAVWFPSAWVSLALYSWLNSAVGPVPLPFTAVSPTSLLIQNTLIVPLAQGLLFWAYIQRAAEGLHRPVWGVVLTAALFAGYGLFTSDLATSAMPGLLLVGLCAAFVVYLTRSAWCGIAVMMTYGLVWTLNEVPTSFMQTMLASYFGGATQASDPFSVRWLLLVIVGGFIGFILLQILRVIAASPDKPAGLRSAPKPLWWLPMALSILILVAGVYSEILLRDLNYVKGQTPVQTAPIVTRTPTPVGPAPVVVPKFPSQAPQATNQKP